MSRSSILIVRASDSVIAGLAGYLSGFLVAAQAKKARMAQLAVVVVTDEKGPKALSLALWLGEAGDHQFLALLTLELEPIARTTLSISRRRALGDYPFPALFAGFFEEGFSLRIAVWGEVQRRLEIEEISKQAFSSLKGKCVESMPVDMDQIEKIKVNGDITGTGLVAIADFHALL